MLISIVGMKRSCTVPVSGCRVPILTNPSSILDWFSMTEESDMTGAENKDQVNGEQIWNPTHRCHLDICLDKSFTYMYEKITRILMESNVILVIGNNVGNGMCEQTT